MSKVTVFEVGARDGLQNEPRPVSLADKAWFISALVQAGVSEIEIGAFVRHDRVPQMADMEHLVAKLKQGPALKSKNVHAWGLVPNLHGLERAKAVGVNRIALFTAVSETFNQHNIGMSIQDSLEVILSIVKSAKSAGQSAAKGTHFRTYVSTSFGCPFEGKIPAKKTLKLIERLADIGVGQISIGDTIGVATPNQVEDLIRPALKMLGRKGVAVHYHDTRGLALANTLRSLELGVTTVDSSAGGLGGCPFAPGATGNLATEDLVYMLDGMGADCGIDLDRLCEVSLEMAKRMRRPLSSRYLQSYASACNQ